MFVCFLSHDIIKYTKCVTKIVIGGLSDVGSTPTTSTRFNLKDMKMDYKTYDIYGNIIGTIQYPTGSQMILEGKNTYSIEVISYLRGINEI